jgi:hypothetical protein
LIDICDARVQRGDRSSLRASDSRDGSGGSDGTRVQSLAQVLSDYAKGDDSFAIDVPPPLMLDLEAGILQVKVALDAVHHVVANRPLVAELDDRAPLGFDQFAQNSLVGK